MAEATQESSAGELSKQHDESLLKAKEALDNANALKVKMEQEEIRARAEEVAAAKAEREKALLDLTKSPHWYEFAVAALAGILSNPGTSVRIDIPAKVIEIANAMVKALPKEGN